MTTTITITIDPDGKIDVMHNIPRLYQNSTIIKVIDQKQEYVDTVTDIAFITESEQMEFVAQHLSSGFEDRAL